MAAERPNVVFVMLDTARADYFRAYGGSVHLPSIDAMSARGTVFENAVAPATYTAPSHVSIFLGRRVGSVRRLMEDKMKNYDKNIDPFLVKSRLIQKGELTLARKLSYLGYGTSLFSNNPLVTEYTGVAEGFSFLSYTNNIAIMSKHKMNRNVVRTPLRMVGNDMLRNRLIELATVISRAMPEKSLDSLYLRLRGKLNRAYAEESDFYSIDLGARDTNRLIGRRMKGADGPQFIFINYMEAHEGYPTNMVTSRYVEQDKWLYLSGIINPEREMDVIKDACRLRLEYLDTQVGKLIGTLKDRGMLDNAIVIFAGDHGQGFMEHGQMYHSAFPYEEIVKVPLIFARFEDGKQVRYGNRIEKPVSLTSLHGAIEEIAYGKRYEEVLSRVSAPRYAIAEHTGITEVWDTHLLRLIRGRSRHADSIYRAKVRLNTFATAVFYGKYKLIHYRNGRERDALFDLERDSGERENIIGQRRGIALNMLRAGMVA